MESEVLVLQRELLVRANVCNCSPAHRQPSSSMADGCMTVVQCKTDRSVIETSGAQTSVSMLNGLGILLRHKRPMAMDTCYREK